ncbi:hypothetical protein KY285_030155 [Solanum tuberosum]|nr:hypothetical protein KY285_030155 [Solanum tuberosum]
MAFFWDHNTNFQLNSYNTLCNKKAIACKYQHVDCKMFVAAFAEFLSDGIPTPKNGFHSKYLCTRYGDLLWKYGTKKAKPEYVSENDDPTRPKSHSTEPAQEDLVNVD